jgi:hypothetical protein
MMACPALSFRPANGTLMARQGVGSLGRVLGSVLTDPLSWGFGVERAKVSDTTVERAKVSDTTT